MAEDQETDLIAESPEQHACGLRPFAHPFRISRHHGGTLNHPACVCVHISIRKQTEKPFVADQKSYGIVNERLTIAASNRQIADFALNYSFDRTINWPILLPDGG